MVAEYRFIVLKFKICLWYLQLFKLQFNITFRWIFHRVIFFFLTLYMQVFRNAFLFEWTSSMVDFYFGLNTDSCTGPNINYFCIVIVNYAFGCTKLSFIFLYNWWNNNQQSFAYLRIFSVWLIFSLITNSIKYNSFAAQKKQTTANEMNAHLLYTPWTSYVVYKNKAQFLYYLFLLLLCVCVFFSNSSDSLFAIIVNTIDFRF